MEKQVWKFELTPSRKQAIEMPINAEILTIQTQFGNPCIWALVDPNAKKEQRGFEIFGTGLSIIYDMLVVRNYIGTYQVNDGQYVFHVFERI